MLKGNSSGSNLSEIIRLSLPMNTKIHSERDLSQQKVSWSVVLTDLSVADSLVKLGDLALLPGMPAEVYINTGSRTFLSYLFKPLSNTAARSFNED